uniref:Kappa-ctenitoxin-Pn1a n=1 Tax=Phoneutria nigriventer TaxID=6918 RepID=TX20A_PHONI|nr:RecName: Full=Kappa-ctenitoxin-Pn1a; Short=Kappa-CNTX-Pn1a; AltName: Full=Neurotoxin Tx3-1; AltName: Full=PNTx3-1; AltName: Full=PhKv; Flags: Precursor [Phoneutria nigriventer]AAC26167.1 Tx3-1 neurotoxin [Phoneutria nigriventer]
MWFKIQVLVLAITLITLGIQAEPNSSPNNPLIVEEDRAECAAVYERCGKGYKRCCEERPCKCNIVMDNCTCKKFISELFGFGK